VRLIRSLLGCVVAVGLVVVPAPVAAQATGTTTFNAPYRAFTRSEIGALLSFPDGGGTAIEGVYRMAGSRFDFGFKAGFFDPPGPGHTELLIGAEARQRVITHTVDFPLDGALLLGVGGDGDPRRAVARPSHRSAGLDGEHRPLRRADGVPARR